MTVTHEELKAGDAVFDRHKYGFGVVSEVTPLPGADSVHCLIDLRYREDGEVKHGQATGESVDVVPSERIPTNTMSSRMMWAEYR